MANPRWALDVRKPRMKLPIRGRIFQVKLPARARRAEITTRAPIIGLAEVNVGYGCVEPLKILSVEGPFQRVQRENTEEPKPDTSIPHHGRKTLGFCQVFGCSRTLTCSHRLRGLPSSSGSPSLLHLRALAPQRLVVSFRQGTVERQPPPHAQGWEACAIASQ